MDDLAYPLVAIRDDGETIVAETPEEARALRRLNPGPQHAQSWSITLLRGDREILRTDFVRSEWIVRDHYGARVLREDLPEIVRVNGGWYRRRLQEAAFAAERGLPIPNTGKRGRYSSGFRSFAFNIAMRAEEAGLADDLADWDIPHMMVGRRRSKKLPQVWDDVVWRARRRSWKSNRATQWR